VRLHTSGGVEVENPTSDDIERVLSELPVNPDYDVVLSASDDAFIQARGEVQTEWAGGATEGLIVHALDGAHQMFESVKRHPVSIVIRLFQLYARQNPQWKEGIEWREYGGASSTLLLLVVILLGGFLLWRAIL
jgi:hypothetical protein